MIPKIIHYCWFGTSKIPDEYLANIEEWKAMLPDWEIKEWSESNFIDTTGYFTKAILNGNWANASNYSRLKVIEEYGGIYLDTDVKLIKSPDHLLQYRCFLGFEEGGAESRLFWVNNAVFGAERQHPFLHRCINELLTAFDGSEPANESSPKLVTAVLKKYYGLEKYGTQLLADGIRLFSSEYFYPIPWYLAKNSKEFERFVFPDTVTVHLWGRSWYSREMMLDMIDELQSWSHNASREIHLLHETVSGKENENIQLQRDIIQLQDKIGEQLAFSNKNLAEKAAEISSLNLLLDKKDEGLQSKDAEIAFIKSNFDELNKQKDHYQQEHSLVKELNNQKEGQVNELILQLKTLDNVKILLSELFEKYSFSSTEIEKQFQQLRHQFEQFSGLLSQLQQGNVSLHLFLGQLLEDKKRSSELIQTLLDEVKQITSNGEQMNKYYSVLQQQYENLSGEHKIKFELLSDLLEFQKNNTRQMERNLHLMNKMVVSKSEQNTGLANEIKVLKLTMQDFEMEIGHKNQEIENLKKSVNWYHNTYERRSLIGVVKEKMQVYFRKTKQ